MEGRGDGAGAAGFNPGFLLRHRGMIKLAVILSN